MRRRKFIGLAAGATVGAIAGASLLTGEAWTLLDVSVVTSPTDPATWFRSSMLESSTMLTKPVVDGSFFVPESFVVDVRRALGYADAERAFFRGVEIRETRKLAV